MMGKKPIPLDDTLKERVFNRLSYDKVTGYFAWLPPSDDQRRNTRYIGCRAGSVTKSGYVTIALGDYGKTKLIFAHRLAFLFENRDWLGEEVYVDHINGVRDDNRFSNLRLCNGSQNGKSVGMKRNNKSGFKGVYFREERSFKWRSQILVDGKKIMLGHYGTAEQAARVYDDAAIKYHGDFAKTNKMLGLI